MILLDDLMTFLDQYVGTPESAAQVDPQMANGLQVRGRQEINTIVTGVSASLRFFEEALGLGADALVVHHALNMPADIHFDYVFSNRLRFLMEHGLSLIGYHYLLDSHPQIGNNVQIIKSLGAHPVDPYPYPPGDWGWVGEFEGGIDLDTALMRCTKLFSQEGVQYPFGPQSVRRMVALSGGGAPGTVQMEWLVQNGIDLYVTGEAREWNRELFREVGINFVAAGHYHTERIGIQSLSEVLRTQLGVAVKFLDLPNSV